MPTAALRAAVGIAALVGAAASPAAASVDRAPVAAVSRSAVASGTPGYCPSAAGVTVVVDMSALGGGVTVRCASGPVGPGFSGIDALHDAGFTVTGTQRYGLAFVCRIQGRPSAGEPLAIPGNPRYLEQCVNTPPQTAFWSYWYAPNGGSWTYSSLAAQSRDAIPGGFEGWAFSLGSARPAAPAVGPTRPKTKPTGPPPAPPTTSPPTPPPPPHHHGKPGGGGSRPPGTASPGGGATSPPPPTSPTRAGSTTNPTGSSKPTKTSARPRGSSAPGHRHRGRAGTPSTQDPSLTPPTTGSAGGQSSNSVTVSGDLPRDAGQSAGSARPTLIGLGVLLLLGLGVGLTAWRRSHRT